MPNHNGSNSTRWIEAQRLELDFWSHWEEIDAYRNLDVRKYWREEIEHFGIPWETFRGIRVLDVGCGPVGLIHFLDHAAERIRIDPLLSEYERKMSLPSPQLSLTAMGEALPLAAESVDAVVCFNALDHMRDPAAALAEIARVLRPGGAALLMIHTFPAWARFFFWVDRMHPHHYTAKSFAAMVGNLFTVEHCKTIRRRFEMPFAKWFFPSSWKYLAGNLVVSSSYIRASKSRH